VELNALFARARGELEARKNFVADAAHELRSPLTALKLQAQALRRPVEAGDDPGTREAAVARLNQGIDRTIHLVEQLLALARAEGGEATAAEPLHTATDLHEVARLAVADVLSHAQARGIDLGLDEASTHQALRVRGDTEALRALLRNLLDNAVKYTPAPGRVDVSLTREADQAVLRVDDSGPGIPEAERERVFDRFIRGELAGAASRVTGSGLGLAIVRAIADRHGATLTLGSSPALGGLRVECRLPLL
jgi:two-component system OmpR family sensor kinase